MQNLTLLWKFSDFIDGGTLIVDLFLINYFCYLFVYPVLQALLEPSIFLSLVLGGCAGAAMLPVSGHFKQGLIEMAVMLSTFLLCMKKITGRYNYKMTKKTQKRLINLNACSKQGNGGKVSLSLQSVTDLLGYVQKILLLTFPHKTRRYRANKTKCMAYDR